MQRVLTELSDRMGQNNALFPGTGAAGDDGIKNLAQGVDQLVRQMRAEQTVVREWVDEQSAQQSEAVSVLKDLAQSINRVPR